MDKSEAPRRGDRDLRSSTEGSRRLLGRPPMTRQAQDRITLFAVRALFFFISAGLGVYGVKVVGAVSSRPDLDPFMGIIVACCTALVLILMEVFLAKSPIRTLSAITFGILIGLAMSLVFQFVVAFIVEAVAPMEVRVHPDFSQFLSFLQILVTIIFCYFGVTILLQTRDDFKFIIPYVEFRREIRSQTPLILDTSCFVDGRLQNLLETGIFDQRLLVPTFVLRELQTIADSPDRSLRERGRRGLDILHEIETSHSVEIVDWALRSGDDVDGGLLIVASEYGGKLVTTDFNLQKNAKVQGVPVLNVNDLATAVKPTFIPGEFLTLRLLREGDDKGQAVGFLKDGTMVVVEGARQRIGQDVSIEVTSSLQTSAGKMVFGKLRKSARDDSSRSENEG